MRWKIFDGAFNAGILIDFMPRLIRKRLTKAVLHSARRDCMMGTNVDMA